MKQLQEKLLALLLMALLTGTGAYAQEASDKQKTPDYRFAVRTNVLYDAFLLPTLGVEWRMNENVGIKLDGSLAWWGGNHGKVQKISTRLAASSRKTPAIRASCGMRD